ncbi:MAG TPA: hypothetical protein VK207_07130 [Bacteroidales bacterium]|jgi:hypothetical protein|nr:hypothetical protein [Bacteroidales bacterium]
MAMIDGGNCVLNLHKIYHINVHEGHTDSELPHNNLSLLLDDDKWADIADNKVELSSPAALNAETDSEVKTKDFSGSIWQPPKSC